MTPPHTPRKTVLIEAISPDRDKCEIVFPRVAGYRVELPREALTAGFANGSTLKGDADTLDPSEVENDAIVGQGVRQINAAIVTPHSDQGPSTVILDPYNRTGSTRSVHFVTTKETLWKTDSDSCHVNWAVCDCKQEERFCEIAERHPLTRAYVKNQGLGFEIPYRYGSETRMYVPDFIVLVETLRKQHPVYLIVEVNGFRMEHVKDKKNAVEQCWVPSINRLGTYGRWDLVELGNIETMENDYRSKVRGCVAEYTIPPYTPAQAAAAKRLISLGGSKPGIEQVPRRKSRL